MLSQLSLVRQLHQPDLSLQQVDAATPGKYLILWLTPWNEMLQAWAIWSSNQVMDFIGGSEASNLIIPKYSDYENSDTDEDFRSSLVEDEGSYLRSAMFRLGRDVQYVWVRIVNGVARGWRVLRRPTDPVEWSPRRYEDTEENATTRIFDIRSKIMLS